MNNFWKIFILVIKLMDIKLNFESNNFLLLKKILISSLKIQIPLFMILNFEIVILTKNNINKDNILEEKIKR